MSVVFAIIVALVVLNPTAASPLILPKAGSRWVDWPAVGFVLRLPVIPHPNWRPGHRGIDLAVQRGTEIHSPASGEIVWVGNINGVASLSILDSHGYKHALLPITTSANVGETVTRGDFVGTVADGNHCQTSCLHWSMRKGRAYVDPRWFATPLLYRLPPTRH
jgi:murein DD-endopeptidase MepM/ murein hydrolase activator NlpD